MFQKTRLDRLEYLLSNQASNNSFLQRSLKWISQSSTGRDRIKRNILLLFTVGLLMILPITINSAARYWAPAGALTIFLITLLYLGGASWVGQRLAHKKGSLRLFGKEMQVSANFLDKPAFFWMWHLLTRLGLLFPAIVFFFFWALLYITVWAWDPGVCVADPAISCQAAFAGLEKAPTLGDFMYFTINMAFANPVPDILAFSRLAHTLVTLEVISGIAIATLYASTFFGLSRERR